MFAGFDKVHKGCERFVKVLHCLSRLAGFVKVC